MTITLQPATLEDAAEIAAILSGWIDETDWMPRVHTKEEDRAFGDFLVTKTDVTVAKGYGNVSGFAAMQGDELQALYVDRAARGQGLGGRLLDHVKASRDNVFLWCFQSNRPARQFYLNNGFYEIGRSDGKANDEKLPDIRYHWARAREARL